MLEKLEISIENIKEHPLQGEVYETEIDINFIESVRKFGILQPILLCNALIVNNELILSDNKKNYVCIAGHRRLKAAKTIGLTEISAVIKDYNSVELIEIDYLESNRQREKKMSEKIAEFKRYNQILCQIAKYKINKGAKFDQNINLDDLRVDLPRVRIFDWTGAAKFLERVKIDICESFNKRDALVAATGLKGSEVRDLIKIEDDVYLDNKMSRWKKFLPLDEVEKYSRQWREISHRFWNKEIGLQEAAKDVQKIIDKVENKINKVEGLKPKKTEKETCYLSLPISENPNAKTEATIYENELSQKYKVSNPVKIGEKMVKDNNGVEASWVVYMEKMLIELDKCKYYAPRGTIDMRKESLGCRIEDVVATLLGKKWIS